MNSIRVEIAKNHILNESTENSINTTESIIS
jgi:hypothetical protein